MNEIAAQNSKQLRRARQGRMLAGVCAGVGRYTGIDPNILRVAVAVSTVFGGFGIGLYLIAWLLVPAEGRDTSIVQDMLDKQKARRGQDGWHEVADRQEPPVTPYGTPQDSWYTQPAAPQQAPQDTPASAAPYAGPDDAYQKTAWRPAESRTEAAQPAQPAQAEEPAHTEQAEKAADTHRPAERPGTDA